jgi:hypothetical protein
MRLKIQTDVRQVTHILTDVEGKDYEDIKNLLMEKGVPMDGFLIECNSKMGYVWTNKIKPAPQAPLFPPPIDARA